MTPAYLDAVTVELLVDGTWQNLSPYVVEDIDIDWGILGNAPSDRMGYTGGMRFKLNNSGGQFSPGITAGFERGAKVRLILTFESRPYVRFIGKISTISLPYNAEEMSVVSVSASDWFRHASKQKVLLQGIETNKTTAQAVEILLGNTATPPARLEIDYGDEVLASVFNTADPKSTIYSELAKLALSEFGYVYLKKDRVNGETLRVEKRHTRTGATVSKFPTPKTAAPGLDLVDGDAFLLVSGEPLLLNELTNITFNNMAKAEVEYGSNLINELTIKHNPVRVDTSLSVLFSLDKPIRIEAGQTLLDLAVSYKDPTGGDGRVNGSGMLQPVGGTDYAFFANENGTGANLTANLSFTVEYGSAGAIYRGITNTGITGGWLTKLQARGYAVYVYNPIEKVLVDQPSIDRFELEPYFIDVHYQSNQNVTDTVAVAVLNQCKDGRISPNKISLCANIDPFVMMAFLNLDVGSLIPVQGEYSLDGNYFIQSVKATIAQGGVIRFDWGLVDALLATTEYWKLEVAGSGELEQTTIISY